MYGELLARLADDLDAGGPTATVLRGHEQDPGPSGLALRLVGSLHRLVLAGRAPELAAYYPTVGGVWSSAGCDAVVRLPRGPRRGAAAAARPGAADQRGGSGGRAGRRAAAADRAVAAPGPAVGDRRQRRAQPPGRPVPALRRGRARGVTRAQPGRPRAGVDRRAAAGRRGPARRRARRLRRQPGRRHHRGRPPDAHVVRLARHDRRHERLAGAIALARTHPVPRRAAGRRDVRRAARPASGTPDGALAQRDVAVRPAGRSRSGSPRGSRSSAGRRATDAPLVHLYAEPTRRTPGRTTGSGSGPRPGPGSGEPVVLGRMAAHGLPVTWE